MTGEVVVAKMYSPVRECTSKVKTGESTLTKEKLIIFF